MAESEGRRYDWRALEREFILNTEYPKVRTWLRQAKGWTEEQINAGNTDDHIEGWGVKRADHQRKITADALESYREAEKERIPALMAAKLNLLSKLIGDITKGTRWDVLSVADRERIYKILKIELGEPTTITQDTPAPDRDPVEALLEEYGLMNDGAIIDVDDQADAEQAVATDDSPSAEIPQN